MRISNILVGEKEKNEASPFEAFTSLILCNLVLTNADIASTLNVVQQTSDLVAVLRVIVYVYDALSCRFKKSIMFQFNSMYNRTEDSPSAAAGFQGICHLQISILTI